ncbi:MAG: bifunctional DNA-binding transcriptional regulator/O6-methylguanine-DNA methyltransferase Ada [Pyrinomonadaceae bacterium]|nr:bifunctional DNA-binding transcriptional regulator/O6-methylguanine-DNA methyltransferase Ada [Pyrinomonadaceae bacterium]
MDEAICWRAVVENDRRFDGLFFTCVKTTKIFCKPSCPAKTPKRENVLFVSDTETAMGKGFRACLRCKPTEITGVNEKTKIAVEACEYINANRRADLNELGKSLGLSSGHLQRVFKSVIGVSPRKYLEFIKLKRFKDGVSGGKEVLEAMYDAGFESTSRLYENANQKIGMTPGRYKEGGRNLVISYSITKCSLGNLLVAATSKGICAVKIGDSPEELSAELGREFVNAEIRVEGALIKHFVDAIVELIEGNEVGLELPIDVKATAFQMRVWDELRKIPFGETITYAELARRIGNEKSVRAVAAACAKNNVAVVVPCHRVIGSDGGLRGYRWGIERKQQLLENEKADIALERKLFT